MASIMMTAVSRKGRRVERRPFYCLDQFEKVARNNQMRTKDQMCGRIKELYLERLLNSRRRVEEGKQKMEGKHKKVKKAGGESKSGRHRDEATVVYDPGSSPSEYKGIGEPHEAWSRLVRIVRLMTCAYIGLRQCGQTAILEGRSKLKKHEVASEPVKKTRMVSKTGASVLAFSVRDFKVSKETRMPESVIRMLVKSPEMRTADEVETIAGLLITAIPSFSRYDHNMKMAMSRVVRYLKCDSRRVVLRDGHKSYNMYYLYSGSVTVIIETANFEADGTNRTLRFPLRRGAFFGDVGVIQDIERTATVVCAQDCEFLTIDKESYIDNGLDLLQTQALETRFQFFRKWPPIARWSDSAIRDLSLASFIEDVTYNKVIVKDNSTDIIWFIFQGCCDVLRAVDAESCQEAARAAAAAADSETVPTKRWERHYPPVKTMALDRVSTIQNDLEDRKKLTCQFQYERIAERRAHGLTVDAREFDKCPEELAMAMISQQSIPPVASASVKVQPPTDKTVRYVKLGVLLPGDCFGLENAFPDAKKYVDPKNVLYLISRGSRLVRTTCSNFRELISLLGVNEPAMRSAARVYQPDTEICDWLDVNRRWRRYRKAVVERTVNNRYSGVKIANFLAHLDSEELGPSVDSVRYGRPAKVIWTGTGLIGPMDNVYNQAILSQAISRGIKKSGPMWFGGGQRIKPSMSSVYGSSRAGSTFSRGR